MSSARPTISFGWYVVAASFVIMFLNAGARLMIGVLFKPVIADFGWSRSAMSAAVLVNLAVFAVAIVVAGRLYDRYGPRWIILVSSVLFSGGLMLTAVMTDLWQFVLFYGVISAAGLGGTSAPIFGAIVSHWFERAGAPPSASPWRGRRSASSRWCRCSPSSSWTRAGGPRCSGWACCASS